MYLRHKTNFLNNKSYNFFFWKACLSHPLQFPTFLHLSPQAWFEQEAFSILRLLRDAVSWCTVVFFFPFSTPHPSLWTGKQTRQFLLLNKIKQRRRWRILEAEPSHRTQHQLYQLKPGLNLRTKQGERGKKDIVYTFPRSFSWGVKIQRSGKEERVIGKERPTFRK